MLGSSWFPATFFSLLKVVASFGYLLCSPLLYGMGSLDMMNTANTMGLNVISRLQRELT